MFFVPETSQKTWGFSCGKGNEVISFLPRKKRGYFVTSLEQNILVFSIPYTLKRNRITSPSFTTYSLPSMRTSPFSFAAVYVPQSRRS